MKKTKLFSILCLALTMASASCSKDEDDDHTPNFPTVDPTPGGNGGNGGNSDKADMGPVVDNSAFRFYGAELLSKETFKYGKFEARMKMAYAHGCISSMFLYYNDSYMGNGKKWNEIDIEVIGKYANSFQSNLITGSKESKKTSETVHNIGAPIAADFHTYTIEWTPTYIAWFLDGQQMRREDSPNQQVVDMVLEQSLRFNIWSSKSTAWVGNLNHAEIPVAQEIDYVKVWDMNEAGDFVERWTDDFDTFDGTRWGKGNWAMENVTEKPANVVVENGVLKLMLTKEEK